MTKIGLNLWVIDADLKVYKIVEVHSVKSISSYPKHTYYGREINAVLHGNKVELKHPIALKDAINDPKYANAISDYMQEWDSGILNAKSTISMEYNSIRVYRQHKQLLK